MKALLVNPAFPDSYWSGRFALRFASRAFMAPLEIRGFQLGKV